MRTGNRISAVTFAALLSFGALRGFAAPAGVYVEGENFDGVEQFEDWQTVRGRWYAKEHLARGLAHGGALAVGNEFSIGAVMRTTLERELPPGPYRIWLRTALWTDSDEAVEVELNGARTTFEWTIKSADRGYRWLSREITTTQAGRDLRIKLLKAGQQNFGETPRPPCKFAIVDAVYVGPADERQEVFPEERFGDQLVIGGAPPPDARPSAASDAPAASPPKRNMVRNGSFEAGVGHGWGTATRVVPLSAQFLASGDAADGGMCLLSQCPESGVSILPIVTQEYALPAKGAYTLSAWFKGAAGAQMRLSLKTMEKGKEKAALTTLAKGSDAWQRATASGELVPGRYFVEITGRDLFRIDAVQLETGDTATDFKPRAAVEVGLSADVPGRVFFAGETARFDLAVAASPEFAGKECAVRCVVRDVWDAPVLEKRFVVPVQPGRRAAQAVEILPDRLGVFRAEVVAEGVEGSEEEFVFSVMPKPRVMGIDRDAWLGIMPEYQEYIMAALQRAGYKWQQNIRFPAISRWMYAEPKPGEIVWHDEAAALPAKYGIESVGLLHVSYNALPKWVEPSPTNPRVPKDIALWQNFVRRTVERYKDVIHYWQFSDDIHHYFNADEHAMLLKATCEAAKQADPSCRFVGWRYYTREVPGWEEDMKRTEPHSDILYAADGFMRKKYGKPVHNYRFISAASMYSHTADAPEALADLARMRRADVTKCYAIIAQYADSVGKIDGLFFYMAYLGTRPALGRISKNSFEYDGALHLGAVAYGLLHHFLPRGECVGQVPMRRPLTAYVFNEKEGPVALLWSDAGQEAELTFAAPRDAVFRDAMGNPFTPIRREASVVLPLKDTPVMAQFRGETAEGVMASLSAGSVKLPLAVTHTLRAEGSRLGLRVSVANQSGAAVPVTLALDDPDTFPLRHGAAVSLDLGNVPAGVTAAGEFPLSYGLARGADFKAMDVQIAAGERRFAKRWTLWLANARPAPNGANPNEMLGGWEDIFPSRIATTNASSATRRMAQMRTGAITGEEALTQGMAPIVKGNYDISARIRCRWNSAALWVHVDVSDDKVEAGDAVEVFLDTDLEGDRADERPSADDWRLAWTVDAADGTARLFDGQGKEAARIPAAFQRTAQGYQVQFALPWNRIKVAPATGAILGFDVAVTDFDAGTLHAQAVWAGAQHRPADPTGFGFLVLGAEQWTRPTD